MVWSESEDCVLADGTKYEIIFELSDQTLWRDGEMIAHCSIRMGGLIYGVGKGKSADPITPLRVAATKKALEVRKEEQEGKPPSGLSLDLSDWK